MREKRRTWIVLVLALVMLAAAARGEAGPTGREERLALAREKYNARTVNLYRQGWGRDRAGKLNICFYASGGREVTGIRIKESIQITDEAEMEAVLELIAANENYDPDKFGTISFMKAQWTVHNLLYTMAEGETEIGELIASMMGEDVSSVLDRAAELDLCPAASMPAGERMLYEMFEWIQLPGGG